MNIINSLYSLLLEYKVEIPLIQRDYSHGRKNDSHIENVRKNLLSDIKSICDKEEYEELNLNYVYGKVNDDIFYPVDGQQRLTTLFLLALYSCENDDDLKLFTKFSYSARVTTRDFVECLIKYKKKIFENKEKLSKYIKDQFWFNYSWNYDASILSMLNMLDYIVNFGFDKKKLYEGIFSKTKARIKFDYLNLENIGNEDDLYIKLNARGKFLTSFEIFKSKLTLKARLLYGEEKYKIFTKKIDKEWSDFFWNNYKVYYDEVYLRFFQLYLSNHEYIEKSVNDKTDNWVYDNSYLERITIDDLNVWAKMLDYYSSNSDEKSKSLFINLIREEETYLKRTIFHGLTCYFKNDNDINNQSFLEWQRIVKNLCYNAQIRDNNNYVNSIKEFNKLSKYSHNILNELSGNNEIKIGSPFTKQQEEEIKKSKLMCESSEIYNAITYCEESIKYFDGQINGILELSHFPENKNVDVFLKITNKIKKLFKDDEPLYNNFRSILIATCGDYRIPIKNNNDTYTFCQDDHKESDENSTPSFKRLFNEYYEKIKKFIDILNENNDYNTLFEEIICNNTYKQNEWEYCFLKDPSLFKIMKSTQMKSFYKNGEFVMIYNSSSNGTNASLYLVLLQKLLKEKNIESKYESNFGKNGDRWLEVKNMKIEFKNDMYIIDKKEKFYGEKLIDEIIDCIVNFPLN